MNVSLADVSDPVWIW